jgi:hypothetical protein
MSHHAATFQSVFDKTATAYDVLCAVSDRIYWLDDTYVQPFYAWAALRLRNVAISGLFWGLIALIDVALWLAATTRQFMARDAQAIALSAFAQAHEPLPEFPALALAVGPLALLPMAPNLEVLDDIAPVLTLYPTVMPIPMAFSLFVPDDSVRRWLTSALPLAIAPFLAEVESVPVSPAVAPVVAEGTEAAPVVKKARQSKTTNIKAEKTATDKTPRKRSSKRPKATAQ